MELSKSALRVMNVLWERGDITAKDLSVILNEEYGWNKNTTYTVVNQCIKKGLIERREPSFTCHALIDREDVQLHEIDNLMSTLFKNSPKLLFSTLVQNSRLSPSDIDELRHLIDKMD